MDEWDLWSNPLEAKRSCQTQPFPLFTLSTFNQLTNTCKALNSILCGKIYGKFPRDEILDIFHENRNHPFDIILRASGTASLLEEKMLPHHFHLRLIHLVTLAQMSSRSPRSAENGHLPSQYVDRSVIFSEIDSLVEAFGNRFGQDVTPSTWSLIGSIVSNSRGTVCTRKTFHGSQAFGHNSTENYTGIELESSGPRHIRPMPPEEEPNREIFPPSHREIQHADTLTDGNSVFNDFLAIDASEWYVYISITLADYLSLVGQQTGKKDYSTLDSLPIPLPATFTRFVRLIYYNRLGRSCIDILIK